MNKLKRVAAAVLTAVVLFCSIGSTAGAAGLQLDVVPDFVFYRTSPKQTFSGEIDIRNGKELPSEVVVAGDDPALYIAEFDEKTASFDSLYKTAAQTILVTRSNGTEEFPVSLAVYDSVTLAQDTGSVTLTVRNNRTRKAVTGAVYSLYRDNKQIDKGLSTDSSGKLTIRDLAPGDYELRPESAPKGYLLTEASVPFTIGGISLAGGAETFRTSENKKISAEENQTFIAGVYSEDVELMAVKETQISLITLTFSNYGATVDRSGKTLKKNFANVADAAEFLNTEKNEGRICGSVEVSYTLKAKAGQSTCNFTQFIEAETPQNTTPTPAPTPTPTPSPAPTQTPSQNNNSNGSGATSTPSANPITTPAPTHGGIHISAEADDGAREGFIFTVSGATSGGVSFERDYKTNEDGEIDIEIPAGVYNVTPKTSYSKQGYELPQPETVQLNASDSRYLSFTFTATQRDLTLSVVDDDGQPLSGVTVGAFAADLLVKAGTVHSTDSDAVDVSQKLEDAAEDEAYQELLADPYQRKNALQVSKSNIDGIATFEAMPTDGLLFVVLESPDGYSEEANPVEITAGLEREFELVCEYTKVTLTFLNTTTNLPPLDAAVTLRNADEQEIDTWTIDTKPHRLIRVPDGDYTLTIAYGTQEQELDFTVNKNEADHELELQTFVRGNVPEEIKEPSAWWKNVLLVIFIPLLCGGIGFLVYHGVRSYRQRKGGLK